MPGALDARAVRGSVIAGAVAVAMALARLGGFTGGPLACPFAVFTGHACPLCGTTRAAVAMLRGDLALAVALHPAVVAAAPLAGWIAWRWIDDRSVTNSAQAARRMGWALLVGLMAVWLIRGLTGTLPPV